MLVGTLVTCCASASGSVVAFLTWSWEPPAPFSDEADGFLPGRAPPPDVVAFPCVPGPVPLAFRGAFGATAGLSDP